MLKRDQDGRPLTIYQPNERQGGLLWGLGQAYADIRGARHVIWRLFWRDFTAQFRQKLLGYFWALLSPLMGIASFLYLYFVGVLQPGEGEMPYTLYVLLGSSIWSCLPGALGAVSGGLLAQADLIMRTRVPKLALAVSSLASLFYGLLVNMVTTFLIFRFYGLTPSWYFALYPLLALPMLVLGAAGGLGLAVLGTIARDLSGLVTQGLGLLMYVTPVIYLRETVAHPLVRDLIRYNPLTYLVDVPRSLLATGQAERTDLYLLSAAATLALAVLGIRVFYLLEDLAAERL